MWPNTRLLDILQIDHPIIQAPMAGASGIDMAVAVSDAGGLGSIAGAPMDAARLRAVLAEAERRTARPLNINFFAHTPSVAGAERNAGWLRRLGPYYREADVSPPTALSPGPLAPFDGACCQVIEDMKPAVVSFHFGLPSADLFRRVKTTGAITMSSATTVEEARWLAARGCDVIIAQGYEAGGHRGMFLTQDITTQIGTLALVPQIVDAVDVPVIAAGGVSDGRGIAATMALGACGAQIGTAYLLTSESLVSPIYRETLQKSAGHPTAIANVFSGRPSRCLVNRMVAEIGPMSRDAPEFPCGFSATAALRAHAESRGATDFSAHFRGQGSLPANRVSAGTLTRELVADAEHRINCLNRDPGLRPTTNFASGEGGRVLTPVNS